MFKYTKSAILVAALALPVAAFAQAAPAHKATAAKKEAATKVASHSTSGTVKSVSDSELVITKGAGKNAKDETFAVNASTKKDGEVAAGAKVTVAYTTEGSTMTATSIKAAPAKMAKTHAKK